MIRRRLWASLIGIVVVTVGVLALNLGFGNVPVLGLDLRGGVSVILRPEAGATEDDMLVIRDLVRDQLEITGIAEPDVRVEGLNLIVDLPGVEDQEQALDDADVAGIVTLRPVFGCAAPVDPSATTVPGSAPTGSAPGTATAPGSTTPGATASGPSISATSPTTGAPGATTVGPTPAGTTTPATAAGLMSGFARAATPDTTTSATTTPSSAPGRTTASSTPGSTPPATTSPASTPTETAAPVDPVAAGTELLQQADGGQCLVGPPGAAGDEVFAKNSAKVDLNGAQYIVAVDLTATGEAAWNELALACNTQAETCPSKQLAIVLDDIIQSAPVVNEPQFSGSVSISGDFSRDEAEALARVLNRGAFPVQVTPQSVQTVSPTLGEDSLRASVLAGIGGVALVLLLLVVFYRRLTLLILAGMVVWGMLIFSTSAIVSQTTNYTLTLAGVTGIIVSVGVTVDSYVVYFERLKDEIRHGRTFRNSATRAFKASWRTIVAADLVSVIAAAVLFLLSVGSVRGFALYLGITTLCDLVVLFFFTRPAVALLAATGRLDRRDTFGIGVIPSGGGR